MPYLAEFCAGGEQCTADDIAPGTLIDSWGTEFPGHNMTVCAREKRTVIPRPEGYAHTPEDCPHSDESQGIWINNGNNLVCRGCGLDGT